MPRTGMRPLAFLSMKSSSHAPKKKSIVSVTHENLVRVRESKTVELNIFKLWQNTSILVCTMNYQSFAISMVLENLSSSHMILL